MTLPSRQIQSEENQLLARERRRLWASSPTLRSPGHQQWYGTRNPTFRKVCEYYTRESTVSSDATRKMPINQRSTSTAIVDYIVSTNMIDLIDTRGLISSQWIMDRNGGHSFTLSLLKNGIRWSSDVLIAIYRGITKKNQHWMGALYLKPPCIPRWLMEMFTKKPAKICMKDIEDTKSVIKFAKVSMPCKGNILINMMARRFINTRAIGSCVL